MRVLITTDTIGGVWIVTRELTEALLNAGHTVALISFGRAPGPQQQQVCDALAVRHGERFAFCSSDAPLEWMQNNGDTLPLGAALLRQWIDRVQPDIVHSNQFCWGALKLDVPCVLTAHSDVLSWAAACRPAGLEPSPWLDRYRALVQDGLDGADAVVSPTQWMRHALATHFDVPCASHVIANGRSMPCLHDGVKRRLQAVSAGRLWDEAKGVQTLLELTSSVPILLAGEERLDGASTTTGSLQTLGHLDEAELTRVFQQSSMYVCTSLYEPFGLAPLEAALCGCAVIARKLPSLEEVWGDAALYFESAAELDSILDSLSGSAPMLQAAQHKARARAERFSAQTMAHQYLTLFQSLAAGGASPYFAADKQALHAA